MTSKRSQQNYQTYTCLSSQSPTSLDGDSLNRDISWLAHTKIFLIFFLCVIVIIMFEDVIPIKVPYMLISQPKYETLANEPLTNVKKIRKSILTMTDDELNAYFDAILEYKFVGRRDGRKDVKTYDELVAHHALAEMNTTVDQNHYWAAFMIWHSMFVLELEVALQSINPDVTVPYWNWTKAAKLGNDYFLSPIFTDKYFGTTDFSNNYVVNSSWMAYFPISQDPLEYVWWESPKGYLRGVDNYNNSPFVTRNIKYDNYALIYDDVSDDDGLNGTFGFDPEKILSECLTNSSGYANLWSCFWGVPGGDDQGTLHGIFHQIVGGAWTTTNDTSEASLGDVYDLTTSPNDPIFFLHHGFIEKAYYEWRQTVGANIWTSDDPCGKYYADEDGLEYPQPAGHNLYDVFDPPFYGIRTQEEIEMYGGLTIAEACEMIQPENAPYQYE